MVQGKSIKVCVTGGAGFVGSHLVDALLEHGYDVFVVDHFKREKKRFLNPNVRIYKVALSDPAIRDIFFEERPDIVCHLAAQISVTSSVKDPINDARINVLDALSVLQAAREAGVKKVVFASSGAAIYGDHDVFPTPELFDSRPISPYGVTKQAFERYLVALHAVGGPDYVNLRFANIYGPRQLPKSGGEAGVVPIFLEKLRTGEPVTIFGDGSSTRDYLYVLDAVEAFLAAIRTDVSGTFNIATGYETSVLDLWKKFLAVHGESHPQEFAPEREGEIFRSVLDPSLAEQKLGWKAKVMLDEGVAKTYRWFMDEFNQ